MNPLRLFAYTVIFFEVNVWNKFTEFIFQIPK